MGLKFLVTHRKKKDLIQKKAGYQTSKFPICDQDETDKMLMFHKSLATSIKNY